MAKTKKLTKGKRGKPSSREAMKKWRAQKAPGSRDTSGVPLKKSAIKGMTQAEAVAALRKRFDRKCARFASYADLESFWLQVRGKFKAKLQKNVGAARDADVRRFQGRPDVELERKITRGRDVLRKQLGFVERWMQSCANKLNVENPAFKHPAGF